MSVKTVDEYVASLRKLKPTAYMFGKKLENVVDNPRIRGGINSTGATYELANSEKHRDLFTTVSPFTGERINPLHPPAPIRSRPGMQGEDQPYPGKPCGDLPSAVHGPGLHERPLDREL